MLCGTKLIRGKKFISCHANHCKDKKGPRFKIPLDSTPHNIDGMFHERMIYCCTCGEELYKDDTIIMCIDGCESLVTFNDLEGQKKLTIPDKSLTPMSHESDAKAETSFRTKVNETSLTKPKRSSTTDTIVPLAPPATMQKPKPEHPPRKTLEESSKVQAAAEPPAKPKTKPEHPPRKKLEESSKVQADAEPPAKPKTKLEHPPRKKLEESSKIQAAAEPPAKPKTKLEHPPRKTLEESSKVQAAAEPPAKPKTKPERPLRKNLEESSEVQAAAEPKPKTKPEHPPRKMLEESSEVQPAAEPPVKPKTKPEQTRPKTSETDIKHAGKRKPTQSSVDKEKTKQNISSNRQNTKLSEKMAPRTSLQSNDFGLKEVVSDPLLSEPTSTKFDIGSEESFVSKLHL